MMAVQFSLTTEGFERFSALLRDPNFTGRPLGLFLSRAGSAGRGAARKPLLRRGFHGVHFINAADSIRYKADQFAGRVTVFSLMPAYRARAIEEGRPAVRPPAVPIARWALRRPNLTRRRLPALTEEERSQVFRAVQTIESRGVPAKGVFAGVEEHWRANLPKMLDQVARRLRDLQRVGNVRVGSERGQPQFEVEVLREEASRYGMEPASVAEAVEQAMRGTLASEFSDFDRKVPIMVRLPEELRYDVGTLQGLRHNGTPLREVIRVDESLGPAEIRREEQGRVVSVLADVRTGGLDGAIAEVQGALAELPPPPGIRVDVGGENEEMRRSFRDLAFAFGLALILVYMILAAQFESFIHPFTILAAVPLAVIGAVLALFLAGEGMNTMSLIGMVILVGIVVNDSIVKVDFIVQARERGSALRDAIVEAGRIRLRPIVMTTVTTVLGLTPMALGMGAGADLRAPLAIAVIGGLIVATLLTLIVVPVIFSVVESARIAVAGEREPERARGRRTEEGRGFAPGPAQPEGAP
jgi:multidrug efflux pump subunit AcrB